MNKSDKNIIPDEDMLNGIKGNVDLVCAVMGETLNAELSLDEKSVKLIDKYINDNREEFDDETREKLVSILGSFLGEAILKRYGGKWVLNEDYLCIHFGEENFAFPFSKIRKHLFDGPEDSIHSFFTTIPVIMDGKTRIQNEKM